MRAFIHRVFLNFLLPFIILLACVIVWDPFRVVFSYDDYYSNNPINGNREVVCLELFLKREIKPTSFIIGNSRSQAFKTNYWSRKINVNPLSCFHYDGSSMGLFRASKAFEFLDANTSEIRNALFVVDPEFFKELSNPRGHLFIQPPDVSGGNFLSYHLTFLKSSLDFTFLYCNLIYSVTEHYYNFMKNHIIKSKYWHKSNNSSGDVWYGNDQEISIDSTGYYNNLIQSGVFYRQDSKVKQSKKLIGAEQLKLLHNISEVMHRNNTKVKFVVSPLYNQVQFNSEDLSILKSIFGDDNVYDFSGVNSFTSDLTNYYESSHYKPYVANRIVDVVYHEQ